MLRKIGQKEFKPLKDLSLQGGKINLSIVGKIYIIKTFLISPKNKNKIKISFWFVLLTDMP